MCKRNFLRMAMAVCENMLSAQYLIKLVAQPVHSMVANTACPLQQRRRPPNPTAHLQAENVSAEMVEAATIDDELEEEVSFEQLEAVDEM